MTPTRRWGFFGGTFDPPHLGHLRAAEEAREVLALDRVWFAPTGRNPLKSGASAAAADRLAMVAAAIAGHDAFSLYDAEALAGGPSYTADTLAAFTAQHPGVRMVLLLGADAWRGMRRWRRPTEVLALAEVAVFVRPGVRLAPPERLLRTIDPGATVWYAESQVEPTWDIELHRAEGTSVRTRLTYVNNTPLSISSTDIRSRCARGASLRYLVPEAVRTCIAERGLYRDA